MRVEKFVPSVVNQDIALDTYLSTLLDEIPNDLAIEQSEQKVVTELLVKSKEGLKRAVKLETEAVKNIAKKPQLTEQSVVKTVNPLAVMPDWTQHEFQALFFKVGKVVLAAPLTELLRTIKVEKAPTRIPGQPSWFMGLLDTHEQRIGVLDTGQLIFGKTRGQQRNLDEQPFKSILISGDGRWGLACDEILSIGKIEPEKVRWRTVRQKRPWLVGTVIEELTAIVDVDKLVPHRKAG